MEAKTVPSFIFGTEDKKSLKGFLKGLETRTQKEFDTIVLPKYSELASVDHWVGHFRALKEEEEKENQKIKLK